MDFFLCLLTIKHENEVIYEYQLYWKVCMYESNKNYFEDRVTVHKTLDYQFYKKRLG